MDDVVESIGGDSQGWKVACWSDTLPEVRSSRSLGGEAAPCESIRIVQLIRL